MRVTERQRHRQTERPTLRCRQQASEHEIDIFGDDLSRQSICQGTSRILGKLEGVLMVRDYMASTLMLIVLGAQALLADYLVSHVNFTVDFVCHINQCNRMCE